MASQDCNNIDSGSVGFKTDSHINLDLDFISAYHVC